LGAPIFSARPPTFGGLDNPPLALEKPRLGIIDNIHPIGY